MAEENTPIVPEPPAPPASSSPLAPLAPPASSSPLAPLAPLPVPSQTGSSRKLWAWVIGIVVLLFLCGGLAIGGVIYGLGPGLFGDGGLLSDFLGGMDTVRWSGDGSHAIVQTYAKDGSPRVVAVDPESGDVIGDEGWVLVAVEPTGSVLWLVKSDSEAVKADQDGDMVLGMQADGTFDTPTEDLYRWDVASGDVTPHLAVDLHWADLEGPTGGVAHFGIDPLKGAYPSELELESAGVASRVQLPKGFSTFGVVGWSPSGHYFAVEELLQIEDESTSLSEAFSNEGPGRRLLIIDARTGEIVFQRPVLTNSYGRPLWDPRIDVVYYDDEGIWDDESDSGPAATLMVARPDGSSEDAFTALEIEKPSSWNSAYAVDLLGADETGVLVAVEGDMNSALWLVGDGVLENTGSITSEYDSEWRRGAGLISIETENDVDYTTETSVLVRYDIHGGSREELWRGETVDIGGFYD